MPIETDKISIPNGTAVRVIAASNMSQDIAITNSKPDGTDSIYIGADNTVDADSGFEVKAGESITMTLRAADDIFAIGFAAGLEARVLVITKGQ